MPAPCRLFGDAGHKSPICKDLPAIGSKKRHAYFLNIWAMASASSPSPPVPKPPWLSAVPGVMAAAPHKPVPPQKPVIS